jgi:hypothetical protein
MFISFQLISEQILYEVKRKSDTSIKYRCTVLLSPWTVSNGICKFVPGEEKPLSDEETPTETDSVRIKPIFESGQ